MMRHVRPIVALVVMASVLSACSIVGRTYAETMTVAVTEMRKTQDLFRQVRDRYDRAFDQQTITPDQYDAWRVFYIGVYRPQMVRAIGDMNSAQNRAELTREKGPIDTYRMLYQRLMILNAQWEAAVKKGTP